MLSEYRKHTEQRAQQGIPPLPLDAAQTAALCDLLLAPPKGEEAFLETLLTERIPPGVDPAAEVKAALLHAIATGEKKSPVIKPDKAVLLLGTMLGGYNVQPLVELLSHATLGVRAAEGLAKTLLVFDAFNDVAKLADAGNANAKTVLKAWADGAWFNERPALPDQIEVVVFKVAGEVNTDDFSPAGQAFSRPDIPLHALSMGETRFVGGNQKIAGLRASGKQVAFVGDV
ncbi:MAG: aconitate hydratase B, partial [Polyangiaceae bacterium]|nr:aconitate hydratase B [Polyangiaceae bacterium]